MSCCHGCCGSAHVTEHTSGHESGHGSAHEAAHIHEAHGETSYMAPLVSLFMLIAGVIMGHVGVYWFVENKWIELLWYIVAFLPVGFPVIKEACEGIAELDFFNEFTLMGIACIGAFCIGEYPEAVGVMLFYSVGETLQDKAVDRARRDITRLVDRRGDRARVIRGNSSEEINPRNVTVGETIEVRPGERVTLDGVLEGSAATFDTSALTGESLPREIEAGGEVLAGMISTGNRVRIRVTKEYGKSAISRILEMVEEAAGRKASTELFIRRFARVYTPVVMSLALLLVIVPWIVALANPAFHYVFSEWLYRALVFLVISCPCALVVSVPLGYFAGIGAASKAGILFKGGNYLEAVRRVNTVAFDKTGTLTSGTFTVKKVESVDRPEEEFLALLAAAERNSTHPLAKVVVAYVEGRQIVIPEVEIVREISGRGTKVTASSPVYGKKMEIVAGNLRLMGESGIACPPELSALSDTLIVCAVDGRYAGYVMLEDTLKPDAAETVDALKNLGVGRVVMLSGDRKETVAKNAEELGIKEAYGELLPQDKAEYIGKIGSASGNKTAFVGDGMNDAPVLAMSDVGIAMGGLGSDAAIESADIVVRDDNPKKVATAIKIGRYTHTIVTENIAGAIGIKVTILVLGAFGIASLWAAVFADVGVALLAILNSMRIFRKKFN